MTARYFVVERGPLGEFPAIYHDELPLTPANPIVYAPRLDTLPHAERWMAMSLAELHHQYLVRVAGGNLPSSNVGKASGAQR